MQEAVQVVDTLGKQTELVELEVVGILTPLELLIEVVVVVVVNFLLVEVQEVLVFL